MGDNVRAVIQACTLLLSVFSLIQLVYLCYFRLFAWRLILFPAIVVFEVFVFYSVIVVFGPLFDFSIGPYANYISATIRFQSAALLTTYLSFFIYTKVKVNNDD